MRQVLWDIAFGYVVGMAMNYHLLMDGPQILGQAAPMDLKFTFWTTHYSTTYKKEIVYKKEILLLSETGKVQVDGSGPHGLYGFNNWGNSANGLGDILYIQWSWKGAKGVPELHIYQRVEDAQSFELIQGPPNRPWRPHVLLLNGGQRL